MLSSASTSSAAPITPSASPASAASRHLSIASAIARSRAGALPLVAFDRADLVDQRPGLRVLGVDTQRPPRQFGGRRHVALGQTAPGFADQLLHLLLIEGGPRLLHQCRGLGVFGTDQRHLLAGVQHLDVAAGVERAVRGLQERLDPFSAALLDDVAVGPRRHRRGRAADDRAFVERRLLVRAELRAQPRDVRPHRRHGLVAPGRVFLDRPVDDGLERRIQIGHPRAQRHRGLTHDRVHDLVHGLARERLVVREQLVHDQAGREDVAAAVAGFALDLLRGHVVGSPHDHAGLGEAGIGDPRDAEIQDAQDAFAVDHHVRRLDVAVHHALVVRVLEAGGQFFEQLELPRQGQRNVLLDVLGEGRPLDVFHDDVGGAFVFAEVVDGDDVGVFEAARGLRLAEKAIVEVLVGDPQQLDRDHPSDVRVAAAKHHPHAAEPDTVEDVVAADSFRKMRRRHGCGGWPRTGRAGRRPSRYHGCFSGWGRVKSQAPNPKLQPLPNPNSQADSRLPGSCPGVWELKLGSWELGVVGIWDLELGI